jgi:hypothetical protein
MNNCFCCSGKLLRHIRGTGIYWFCPGCWQEVPDLQGMIQASHKVHETKLVLTPNASKPGKGEVSESKRAIEGERSNR